MDKAKEEAKKGQKLDLRVLQPQLFLPDPVQGAGGAVRSPKTVRQLRRKVVLYLNVTTHVEGDKTRICWGRRAGEGSPT